MKHVGIAKVLLRNNDGNYLILRGSLWPERPDRSQKPDVPGGLVDPGETHAQAAVREVKEETGITIAESDLTLIHAESFVFENETEHEAITRLIYSADLLHTPEVTVSWEHEGYWWYSAEELLGLDIRQPYPKIFEYLKTVDLLK